MHKKTNVIRFKTHQNKQQAEPLIFFNSQAIDIKSSTKFLGLTVDQHLDWNKHVDHILLKLSSGIYSLYRMSFFCNEKTLRNIYFANIHSHISFVPICLFGSTTKTNIDKILNQQKRVIRII